MRDRELRRSLSRLHAPDELAAERRAWSLARTSFERREPVPRRPRNLAKPTLALVTLAAVVAVIASPPVWSSIRDTVGRTTTVVAVHRQALFSLPAQGRLLVDSPWGPWIVQPDGSRRLLGRYGEATWSPRGLFVAALGTHELVALDPKGTVRWSLARSGSLASPRWSPELSGSTRIAYLRGHTLRVVAGDGTDDRRLARSVTGVAPAWRPGTFTLAYVDGTGHVHSASSSSGKTHWRAAAPQPVQIAWSSDGKRLLVLLQRALYVYRGGDGARVSTARLPANAVSAAFQPGSHRVAVVLRYPQRSELVLRDGDHARTKPKLLFSAGGDFGQVSWSPGGRWTVVGWPSANALAFVGPGDRRQVVGDVARQFRSGAGGRSGFPTLPENAWCCAFSG